MDACRSFEDFKLTHYPAARSIRATVRGGGRIQNTGDGGLRAGYDRATM